MWHSISTVLLEIIMIAKKSVQVHGQYIWICLWVPKDIEQKTRVWCYPFLGWLTMTHERVFLVVAHLLWNSCPEVSFLGDFPLPHFLFWQASGALLKLQSYVSALFLFLLCLCILFYFMLPFAYFWFFKFLIRLSILFCLSPFEPRTRRVGCQF